MFDGPMEQRRPGSRGRRAVVRALVALCPVLGLTELHSACGGSVDSPSDAGLEGGGSGNGCPCPVGHACPAPMCPPPNPDATGGGDLDVSVPPGGSLLGSFSGYFENFRFPSGSDNVAMTLALGADGMTVTGGVLFGQGPPPAPPTNPNVGWPPPNGLNASSIVIEGYDYLVIQGLLQGTRLTLQVLSDQPFGAWCQLQTMTYPWGGGSYRCVPNWGSSMGSECELTPPDGGAPLPIDCQKMAICQNSICACTATGCTLAAPLTSGDVHFDMQLTTGHLDGSTAGLVDTGNLLVHLMMQ
jgi:hypothetical protein